jgi:alpha-glucosidase
LPDNIGLQERIALETETGNEWWRGAIIYQIYPRSFLDCNGDGIGDLPGIIDKLDYVKDLGVDGIWISPFFTSPMADFGYDVSDYVDVDPMFGTLSDFDTLVAKAHRLSLKVIIDQVYSHTSDRHEWFEQSRDGRDNAKAEWYVWADAKRDGSPPNNWQSIFSCPAWTWDARRQQYYMHNFLPQQPDLNLHNPEVQEALLNTARFWLDRGVDGFRLDAINRGMHDPELRDNPPAVGEMRQETRPFFMQEPRYNMCHDDMPRVLESLRSVTDSYDGIFTVAEIGAPDPLPIMKEYTHDARRLNSAYGFEFLATSKLTPGLVQEVLDGWPDQPGEGWPSWAFSNHDAARVATRWLGEIESPRRIRLIAMLQFALRGNVFVYQGEELGLPQADVPFEKLQDPEAINNWPHTMGRDGARTPMPWSETALNAGFSSAEPWLPIDPRHLPLSVDVQEADPTSVLAFFRELIALRKSSRALTAGTLEFLDAPDPIIAFRRRAADETVDCVINLGHESVDWAPGSRVSIDASVGTEPDLLNGQMPAYSGYIGVPGDA